jgi:hypothetical protein
MKTIFETCTPRDEVLKGELKEQQFAASLTKVLRGTAEAVYGDPATFFANTYPTGGLQSLLREALGRLSGKRPDSAPVIRLETSFGGGKTHNLIALYHTCNGELEVKIVKGFVPADLLPKKPIKKIVGIVGPDIGVADGVDHGDVCTYTLWGELAYQLGGAAAYEKVRKSDEQRMAPSTQPWEQLIGDEPALIMIDEIGQYLRVSGGAQVGKTTLAEQTVAFLMSLMKFASGSKGTVLVYTLADSGDAFGKENDQVRAALAESKSVSAREEHVLTPTAEDEISAIVSHRMFAKVEAHAAEETASQYAAYYGRMVEQDVDLPPRALRAEYADEIVKDYPFHPELLTALKRTSTIPNFQKTRGVLRLLAQTIRAMWQKQARDCYLIAPFHVDLSDDQTANDMTSRLDRPQYKEVIEADIASPRAGSLAHAQEVDLEFTGAGRPPYAQRVTTAVFLHSLTQTGQSGVDPADLLLAVLQPDDDPSLVDKAIKRLDCCWYFDYDGLRYRFKPEPSPRKIIDDEMGLVGKIKAKVELDERVQKVWKKGHFIPIYFPAEAAAVDDDAQAPKLVVLHYDAAVANATDAATPSDLVLKLFEHKGSMEEYRTYKNNLMFLVVDKDEVPNLVTVAQYYLAAHRVVADADRMAGFTPTVAEKLKQMADEAELNLRVAITKAYRHLYYPSADAPRKSGNLAHQLLQPDEQGQMAKDQSEVVLKVLKGLDKVLTADDKPLNAQYVKAKAWPANAVTITTEDLRRAFCQRLGMRMLLDINQLKKTIKEGVQKAVWVYYPASEGMGYGPPSPAPMVEISEETTLYTPEEAVRVGIKIKGEEKLPEICPSCHKDPCVCGDEEEDEEDKPHRISGEGTPAQAFQTIADQCHDHSVKSLSRLFIRIEGMGKDAAKDVRSLGLAIPQIGKVQLQVDQRLTLEFGGGEEKFTIEFKGSWDRYKRIKQVTDALSQEASNAGVRMAVRADFDGGLAPDSDQFQTIRDVLVNLGIGKIFVDGQPEAKEGLADE